MNGTEVLEFMLWYLGQLLLWSREGLKIFSPPASKEAESPNTMVLLVPPPPKVEEVLFAFPFPASYIKREFQECFGESWLFIQERWQGRYLYSHCPCPCCSRGFALHSCSFFCFLDSKAQTKHWPYNKIWPSVSNSTLSLKKTWF